jgi:hypothetical protein
MQSRGDRRMALIQQIFNFDLNFAVLDNREKETDFTTNRAPSASRR